MPASPSQIALAAFRAAAAKTPNPVLRAKQELLLRILSGQQVAAAAPSSSSANAKSRVCRGI